MEHGYDLAALHPEDRGAEDPAIHEASAAGLGHSHHPRDADPQSSLHDWSDGEAPAPASSGGRGSARGRDGLPREGVHLLRIYDFCPAPRPLVKLRMVEERCSNRLFSMLRRRANSLHPGLRPPRTVKRRPCGLSRLLPVSARTAASCSLLPERLLWRSPKRAREHFLLHDTLWVLPGGGGSSRQDRPPVEDYVRPGHDEERRGDRLDVAYDPAHPGDHARLEER